MLGYCEKGLNCDKQHIRECPDFAETGDCTQKGCKLPHVIRANRTRKAAISAVSDASSSSGQSRPVDSSGSDANSPSAQRTVLEAELGDEFISLTFNESDDEESDSDDSEEEADDDGEENMDEENNNDGDADSGPDLGSRDDIEMQ